MNYTETKNYINKKRAIKDVFSIMSAIIGLLLFCIVLISFGMDIKANYNNKECKVEGPNGMIDYVSERHPMVLHVPDSGKYTLTIISQ